LQSGKPQIFISVADPVKSKIVSSLDKPDKGATGTSNYIPIDSIFKLADKLTPGIKSYGFIYNFGEPNAVNTIAAAKKYLDGQGVKYEEATVSNAGEVQQAAQALAAKCGAIFIPNDSSVVPAMPQVVEAANAANGGKGIPVYGTALVHVQGGALATVGIEDKKIGAVSADMAIEVFKGKKTADIPVVFFKTLDTYINAKEAKRLGVKIPKDLAGAEMIV
jgi:putative ABC transport system substrate-binding protein